jgi:hypothetical protein
LINSQRVIAGDQRDVFVRAEICKQLEQLTRIGKSVRFNSDSITSINFGAFSGWFSRAIEISKTRIAWSAALRYSLMSCRGVGCSSS